MRFRLPKNSAAPADDDYLVALASEAGAEAIVSGDKDLLDHPAGARRQSTTATEACVVRRRGVMRRPTADAYARTAESRGTSIG